MKSAAFAVRDQVWIRLEASPDRSLPAQQCFFDSLDVAEDFALALFTACREARRYRDKQATA